jgi:hypothetical protein
MITLEGIELTLIQNDIIKERANGKSYGEINLESPIKLHPDHLTTCFPRASKDFWWEIGPPGGPDPYLYNADEEELA